MDSKQGMPVSLRIDPWLSEPDIRGGEMPIPLKGTLTVTGLQAGSSYDIYRWDSVKDAFTYSDNFKKFFFKAANGTFIYTDDKSFQSDSTTYYRCLPHASE